MKRLITSAMALSLLLGGPALAGDKDKNKDKHGGGQQQQQGGGKHGGKHDGGGGNPNRNPGAGAQGIHTLDTPTGLEPYRRANRDRNDNGPNRDRRNDNRGPNWDRRNDNRGPNWNRNDNRAANFNRNRPRNFDRRAYQRNVWAQRKFRLGVYHRPPGWYYRRWTYGQVLPFAFFASQYWLNDWYYYDLPTPPYGYEWVRYGDDAILVDVRTGMILQVMYGVFY